MIRLLLYLIIMGFFLQYAFFGEWGEHFYRPISAVVVVAIVFLLNFFLLLAGARLNHLDQAIAITFAVDILILTRIIMISGGFSSLFLPFYLPILIMAPATLPRRFTAVFPSLAALGATYIGLAYIIRPLGGDWLKSYVYSQEILSSLRMLPPHAAVASILTMSALFFVISYISSVITVRFTALRIRVAEAERVAARFSAISALAASLAHEIRNPLASLRSAIQEIGESFDADSQNRTLAGIVLSESDRLDRIIGRFLAFSREEELRLSPSRLGNILSEIRTMLLKRRDVGDLQVLLTIHDDPEVNCDSDRMREIFLNLALNASQAVGPKGGRLNIMLSASRNSLTPGVEVVFSDNGPGLEKETIKQLFSPFFTTKPNGTGMGLPLSRKHVSLHGGHIEADNNPDGGAIFLVWLPLNHLPPKIESDTGGGNTIRLVKSASGRRK
jgi:signal transduction histidine kinase